MAHNTVLSSLFRFGKRKLGSEAESEEQNSEDIGAKAEVEGDDFGLKLLYTPLHAAEFDIIAVHGLNGHWKRTWTHPANDSSWLSDFLPNDIQNAEIYSYSWDSRTHASSRLTENSFLGIANDMVGAISLERRHRKKTGRPILFLAHSYGGLLVKEALVISQSRSDYHLPEQKEIFVSTIGIIFFGTPHQGTGSAALAAAVVKMAQISQYTNQTLLKNLKFNHEFLERSLQSFSPLAGRLKLKFVYESHKTPILNKFGVSVMVVEKASAVPPIPNVESIDSHRNHVEMVRFGSKKESLYKAIVQHICLIMNPEVSQNHVQELVIGVNIPSENDRFVGRTDELRELHSFFSPLIKPTRILTCAILGAPGIGKTQLALRFVSLHQSSFKLVAWLHASSIASISHDFARIASAVRPDLAGSPDQRKDIQVARDWLEANQNWILVFDNLEIIHILNSFTPRGRGFILFTTQDHDLALTADLKINLKPLEEKDGARLLLGHLQKPPRKAVSETNNRLAADISKELGGLPLAIVHNAGYIQNSAVPLDRFLLLYHSKNSEQIDHSGTALLNQWQADSPDRTYARLWSIALQELGHARPLADTLSFFYPDTIPEKAFLLKYSASEELEYRRKISGLRSRSLIDIEISEQGSVTLSMHRQLQRKLQRELVEIPEVATSIFNSAVEILRGVFPRQDPVIEHMAKDWPACAEYLVHVLSFVAAYKAASSVFGYSRTFASILRDGGQYMWEQSMAREARDLLEVAEQISRGLVRPEEADPLLASVLARRSSVEVDSGFKGLRNAITNFKEAIKIQTAYLEMARQDPSKSIEAKDEIPLANYLNNLAGCYLHRNEPRRAEPLLRQSIDLKKNWSTSENMKYEFAEADKNMAIVRAFQGRTEEALVLAARGIQLTKSAFGSADNTRVYFFRFIRACIQFDAGNLQDSIEEHQEILDARKRLLGDRHGYTAASYYFVGFVLYTLGRLEDAEVMLNAAIKIYSILYECEERLARAKYCLSQVYEKGERNFEARAMEKAAITHLSHLSDVTWRVGDKISMAFVDSLIPVWHGRSFILQNQPNNNAVETDHIESPISPTSDEILIRDR